MENGGKKGGVVLIDIAREIAAERGGSCLSKICKACHEKLKWRCGCGHTWEALFSSVKRGSWCDKCARKASADKRRKGISDIQKIAQSRGGNCLSETYINAHAPLRFKCANGHTWKATPHNIRQGKWCKKCSARRHTCKYSIEVAQQVAINKGGECLSRSEAFRNTKTKLLWRCVNGHKWEASFESVRRGSWCRICGHASSAKKRSKDIEELHRVAANRGGKCLATECPNVDTKISWECSIGHRFVARPSKILKGQWCPTCSGYLGERICREFLSQLFSLEFPKARPEWLVNEKGFRLELDGYNPSLQLAFEHHGLYHYQIDGHFSKNDSEVSRRRLTDELKMKLCSERGVQVIIVPELFRITPLSKLPETIIEQCIKNNIRLPDEHEKIIKNIDLSMAYKCPFSLEEMERLKTIALSYGGVCLSKEYVSSSDKMTFKCVNGHVFQATPNSIKRGTWCYECNGNLPLTIEEMKEIARSRGGGCLSKTYVNCQTKLIWRCAEGHIWQAVPGSIKHGKRWCPVCARQKGGKK